jgi:BMFP domain-containing protein YqiC
MVYSWALDIVGVVNQMNEKILLGLSEQFAQVVSGLNQSSELPGQQQIKSLLQSAMGKMDLVTREEFDAQAAVLGRTREKVEQLERLVSELEQKVDQLSS